MPEIPDNVEGLFRQLDDENLAGCETLGQAAGRFFRGALVETGDFGTALVLAQDFVKAMVSAAGEGGEDDD